MRLNGALITAFFGIAIASISQPAVARTSQRPTSVRLQLASDQLSVLRTIGAQCGRMLAGNAAAGPAAAGLLLPLQVDTCPPIEESKGETARISVIPLRATGVNLLRVEQNFGGTLNLVRYLVVTATRTDEGRTLVLLRALLPAPVQSDSEAKLKGNKMFPSVDAY